MPKVLITGVAGFIGMHSAIRFLREGWEVVGFDNINNYYSIDLKRDRISEILNVTSELNGSFRMIEADLNSRIWDTLKSYDFNVIIHLAAQAGVRFSLKNPRAYIESNILGFQSVLEFAITQKKANFLYASSSSVYGNENEVPYSENDQTNSPKSYYAATKKSNELMAKSYYHTHGLNSIGLRFFTVYGPWGRPDMAPFKFIESAFIGREIKVFNYGNQTRDFTYIDDVIDSVFRLSLTPTTSADVINIGKGNPDELEYFLGVIEKHTNKKLKKEYIARQIGDVDHTYANTLKLSSIIGQHSRVNLDEGIQQMVSWFKKYYGY